MQLMMRIVRVYYCRKLEGKYLEEKEIKDDFRDTVNAAGQFLSIQWPSL